jgi:hypothetical protein
MKKNYSRSFETSPLFSFSNSALESNKTELIDLELDNTAVKKYLPLNNINIQNSSDNKIEVYINQDTQRKYILQPSTIISFDGNVFPAIYYISIKNIGAITIAENLINITTYRIGVKSETLIANIHKKLFKKTNNMLI